MSHTEPIYEADRKCNHSSASPKNLRNSNREQQCSVEVANIEVNTPTENNIISNNVNKYIAHGDHNTLVKQKINSDTPLNQCSWVNTNEWYAAEDSMKTSDNVSLELQHHETETNSFSPEGVTSTSVTSATYLVNDGSNAFASNNSNSNNITSSNDYEPYTNKSNGSNPVYYNNTINWAQGRVVSDIHMPSSVYDNQLIKRNQYTEEQQHQHQYQQEEQPVLILNTTTSGVAGAANMTGQTTTLSTSLSLQDIFAYAAPSINENYSDARYRKFLFVFLFPFFSLVGSPFPTLQVNTLEAERIYVVSGAALRVDFDSPEIILYLVALAMCCQITAIVLVACKVHLGNVQDGALTLPEMVIPCILWLLLALIGAGYNCYRRVPHMLERANRHLISQLSALAASVIDARAKVCIYTWHEYGHGKVRNHHYRYRWMIMAVVCGMMISFAAPATRGGFGFNMFGYGGFTKASALLVFFATFLFTTAITFLLLKMTDMQREIEAKMRVLTDLAFLECRSIAKPSRNVAPCFELDKCFSAPNLLDGFPGWFAIRSVIMYVATSGNHHARSAAMSIFLLTIFLADLVAIGDIFYALTRQYTYSAQYYSTAHSYGLFVFVIWGLIHARYCNVCWCTYSEEFRQLYVMDTAALYHSVKLRDDRASGIITMCRNMVASHDGCPRFFGNRMHSLFIIIIIWVNIAAIAAIAVQLGIVIYY